MIRFRKIPSNERAVDQMVRRMSLFGIETDKAQGLADKAAGIVMAVLYQLDDKIDEATADETDRDMIQQIIFHELNGITMQGLEANAMQGFMSIVQDIINGGKS